MREDPGIEVLIDLHGQIIDQDEGYWVKIEAWRVDSTPDIPHGIRYELTLHEPYGKRILGYDNSHSVKPGKFKYAGGSLLLITNIGISATKAFHTNFEMHSNFWWISSMKSIEC